MTIGFFGVAQLMDVITTVFALANGRIEGAPISRALMPDGQLLPWIAAKLLTILVVSGMAGWVLARHFDRRLSIGMSLAVAVLGIVTLEAAAQNVIVAL